MAVAYELMIDYLDTTSERRVEDPFDNTLRLHRAVKAGFGLEDDDGNYYSSHSNRDDGGYLGAHVATCRAVAAGLPSLSVVSERIGLLIDLYAESQALAHALSFGLDERPRAVCSQAQAVRHDSLHWEELLAAAGSSLAVLALLAAATADGLTDAEAERVSSAYFPWTCALHISMDGLVDLASDRATGQPSQVDHYDSSEEAGARLGMLASKSRTLLSELPQGELHATILSGMAGYYLSAPEVWESESAVVSRRVLGELGSSAWMALSVHALRQADPRAILRQGGKARPPAYRR
jgi:tetraprenyl-beta-curcumene synthase